MLEERIEYKLDINLGNSTISLCRVSVILKDGVEQSRNNHRSAFYPGQIDEVKSFMGVGDDNPTIIYLNSIWTPEVIQAYNDMLAQLAQQEQESINQ